VEDEDLLMDVTVKMLDFLGYRIFPARKPSENSRRSIPMSKSS
jgi:hypothetical protein